MSKTLPIQQVHFRGERDQFLTEGGGGSKLPKWVNEENIRANILRVNAHIAELEHAFEKRDETSLPILTIVDINKEATAKSHRFAIQRPAKEEVSFSSDEEGNYYFNGRKVKVENSDEYAYRLLKTKIQTSYRRPVDFYFRFLARFGPYGTYGNVYYPSITDLICRCYLPKLTK